MKKYLLLAALAGGLVASTTTWADSFDSGRVGHVMEINLSSLKGAQHAVEAHEDYRAAGNFYAIAHADQDLLTMDPPRGSKADWDRLFHRLIDTAMEGVGAAGEHNHARQVDALKRLVETMKEGHGEFR